MSVKSNIPAFLKRILPCLHSEHKLFDLRGVAGDPFAAADLAGSRPFLIEVPLALCRSRMGFHFTRDGSHPLIRTARAYVAGKLLGYAGSPLEEYFCYRQPRNAAEKLALTGNPSPQLIAAPPDAFLMPWQDQSLSQAKKQSMRTKNRELRANEALLPQEHACVSDSTERARLVQFSRLIRLIDSITARGYLRTNERDGDITGKLLHKPGHGFRYILRSGKHRAAVLAALNYEYIPLRMKFRPVPSLQEVSEWPQVRTGMFTADQAVEYFNRIWEGQPPPGAVPSDWNN